MVAWKSGLCAFDNSCLNSPSTAVMEASWKWNTTQFRSTRHRFEECSQRKAVDLSITTLATRFQKEPYQNTDTVTISFVSPLCLFSRSGWMQHQAIKWGVPLPRAGGCNEVLFWGPVQHNPSHGILGLASMLTHQMIYWTKWPDGEPSTFSDLFWK